MHLGILLYLCHAILDLSDMNDYRELRIDAAPCSDTVTDMIAFFLGDAGFESFVPDENGLTAYIKNELFDPGSVDSLIASLPLADIRLSWHEKFVEGQDWNSEWEKNYFQPIVVADSCVIHSSFHHDFPKCRYDIVIDPKMAFGTGHHQTTSLIISRLLDINPAGKSVIDMGTGTGILAILSAMMGAGPVTAIEIDPMAHINAVENVALNGHPEIKVLLGDASQLAEVEPADIFIANINRNVITTDIAAYAAALRQGGTMLLSGFYVEDVPVVAAAAAPFGLIEVDTTERDRWASLRLRKI